MLILRLLRIFWEALLLLLLALLERLRRVSPDASEVPERLRKTLERLGPTFIKAGQSLSLRRDLLSDRYVAALSRLHAGAKPFPSHLARAVIEGSFGRSIGELFESFDDTPAAAASIAQVHKAQLPGGSKVIVKVRRPGIRKLIDRDMRALIWLLRFASTLAPAIARFEPVRLAHQIWINLRRETDFRQEARAATRFANGFLDWPSVHVPRVFEALVSEAAFVQELGAGRLLGDPEVSKEGELYAANLVEIYLHQIFVLGFFHGDPHPGNLFFMPDGTICFHDFGLTGQIDHHTRRQLALFLEAFIFQDPEWMLRVAVDLGLLRAASDPRTLARSMEELLVEYASLPMQQWSMADLLVRVSRLGAGDSLLVPLDLLVLMRALFEVEHALRVLDPDMKLLQTVVDKGRIILHSLIEVPASNELARLGLEAGIAVRDVPRVLASWLSELRRNEFRPGFALRLPELEKAEAGFERTGNRLALALVILGLYIASSLLMQHSLGPRLYGAPVLAMLGYALALWYTFRLARGIARSGRL